MNDVKLPDYVVSAPMIRLEDKSSDLRCGDWG